jgi:hypothetical protein
MTDDQPKNPPPPEPMAWDRLGMFLGDMAAAGKNMTDRNLKLWSTVSQNLSKPPYTMDKWSSDAALGVQAAMSNVQDAWEFMTRAPERERVADTLPTAWMRVPMAVVDKLPDSAEIELTGSDPAGVTELKRSLRTTLGPSRQAYLLEVTNVNQLKPGVYSGSVYVKTPSVRPIANLRVIVERSAG